MIKLFQIEAPHFTAGFCVDKTGTIWRAAPILRWLEDKKLYVAESYCRKRNWKLTQIEELKPGVKSVQQREKEESKSDEDSSQEVSEGLLEMAQEDAADPREITDPYAN